MSYSKRMLRCSSCVGLLCAIILSVAQPAAAQYRGGPGGRSGWSGWSRNWAPLTPPPKLEDFPGRKFTFCTVQYSDNGVYEALGLGWGTDYPHSGENFMIRLAELTTIEINRLENGEPRQEVIRLTNPAIFNYPLLFMSDVGTAEFSRKEARILREYLLRGGFLHADDFWGDLAWENWRKTIEQVLPPEEYPIRDIPLSHDIFHIVFDVKEVPQVPSIQYWYSSRNGTTSERGAATREPHLRGIWDHSGRLMVIMSHNTDLADGWEQERENEEYFREFSVQKSYPLGINIVVYALTH